MNIFHEKFSAGQVCEASGLSNAALQNWLKRGYVIGDKGNVQGTSSRIEGAGSPGAHRRFTFHTTMELALSKALTEEGVSVQHALFAAGMFAHTGDAYISEQHPSRVPSVPFDPQFEGKTLLCVRQDRVSICGWKVGKDILPTIFHSLGRAFTLVDVNPIFDRAVTALGHNVEEVYELSYSADRKFRTAKRQVVG